MLECRHRAEASVCFSWPNRDVTGASRIFPQSGTSQEHLGFVPKAGRHRSISDLSPKRDVVPTFGLRSRQRSKVSDSEIVRHISGAHGELRDVGYMCVQPISPPWLFVRSHFVRRFAEVAQRSTQATPSPSFDSTMRIMKFNHFVSNACVLCGPSPSRKRGHTQQRIQPDLSATSAACRR